MRNDFAIFILSHGRPYNIKTLKALEKANYRGKLYIVIDTEDKDQEKYQYLYGDKIILFNKREVTFDVGDNFDDRSSVVYARNATFDIAEKLGLQYFLQLDDDYNSFTFRRVIDDKLMAIPIKDFNKVVDGMLEFLDVSGAHSVAFAQAGDFIGGKENDNFHKGILRKAMNSFFCRVDRRFEFVARMNDDVTTYVTHGMRGKLFFTITPINLFQEQTQKSKGGLTEMYLNYGTYVKSFYTVMYSPSSVIVAPMGQKHLRLHHRINWNYCVPKILPHSVKKEA